MKKLVAAATAALLAIGLSTMTSTTNADALTVTVDLKSAETFSAVAGSYVTLAGSKVSGDVGAVGAVTTAASTVGGVTHELNTSKAPQARADVLAAYTSADGRTPTEPANSGVLGGQTLTAGVHHAVAAYGLTGKLTLDGGGDTGAVFILQTEGAIVTAAGAKIALINGAKAANVFWQTPTHVVFGAGSKAVGTFLADSYITFGAGSTLEGRAFSNAGYVVLATTKIMTPAVVTPPVVPPVVTPPVVTPPVVVPPVVTPPVVTPPVVTPVVTPVVVVDVCTNIVGVQTVIPDGMEAGPAVVGGPTCVPADEACPGETCGVTPPVEPEVPAEPEMPVGPEMPETPVIGGGPVTPVATTLPVEKLSDTGATMTGWVPLAFGLLLVGAGFMVFRHQGLVLR